MMNIFEVDVDEIVFNIFQSVGLPAGEASNEAHRFLNNLDATFRQVASKSDVQEAAIERLNQHLAWRGYEP